MEKAQIERKKTYVTNAVKHLKFEQRGKRRLHQKPTAGEVKHYRGWLKKELELVHPSLVVALGATAALALTGKALPISPSRGKADSTGSPASSPSIPPISCGFPMRRRGKRPMTNSWRI